MKDPRFSKVLIANRGEIACRIIRTAKAMGYKTVAVYSEADISALHRSMADETVPIGPAPAAQSYLDQEAIIEAAKKTGAQAIHPGYGFLSENAEFAKKVRDAGIVFIGPSHAAISIMGDKARSKRAMIKAGVACIPGYQGTDQTDAQLQKAANEIGFPVMIKAAAGGGGRGMRLVERAEDVNDAITLARNEAKNAFGASDLILERALLKARHVEIQILGDSHGNIVHLGERDCSVQRRHQKVIEEAPCPAMTPTLRDAMGAAAIQAAQSVAYEGAGTVEFLLDTDDNFYFLEMNTRLQVEHPVTECVTGLDLVALQLQVAQGETLPFKQSDIDLTGHAIEARLYAEDPANDFLPATGIVKKWREPNGTAVRTDHGLTTQTTISPHYDAMVAKIIAHGATRDEARLRLIDALKNTNLTGVKTNRSFLLAALNNETFASGDLDTSFISSHMTDWEEASFSKHLACASAVLFTLAHREKFRVEAAPMPASLLNWTSATPISVPFLLSDGATRHRLSLTPEGPHQWRASFEDNDHHTISAQSVSGNNSVLQISGMRHELEHDIIFGANMHTMHIKSEDGDFEIQNLYSQIKNQLEQTGAGSVLAPMHGVLVSLDVEAGQTVQRGDTLGILEAMKMQHSLVAQIDGTVAKTSFQAGEQVPAGACIVEITSGE